jgi:hypothetical protein
MMGLGQKLALLHNSVQQPPKKQDFGGAPMQFVDSEGAHCSVGAEAASSVEPVRASHRKSFGGRDASESSSPV